MIIVEKALLVLNLLLTFILILIIYGMYKILIYKERMNVI